MIGTRGVVTSVVIFTRRNKGMLARLDVVTIPALAFTSAVHLIRRRKLVSLVNIGLIIPWGMGFVIAEISCGRCLT